MLLHDARARIVILVNAMAEAHQQLFAGLHALDVVGHIVDRADFHQHAQHCFVGAAMQRAVERGGGGGRRRNTDPRASCPPAHRGRRAVLLVIRMQNEKNIQRALERRVRLVLQFGGAEQHVQEIAAVAQIVVRIHKRHAQAVPVGKRRERGHLADQAVGLLLARFGIEDVFRVGIKGGKRGDGRKSACPSGGRRNESHREIS